MRIFITGGSGTLGRRLVVDRLRRGTMKERVWEERKVGWLEKLTGR